MSGAIIATTPSQMQEAQQTTLGWCEGRIVDARRDLSYAEQTFNALQRAGARTQPAVSLIRKARRRITFYEKVKRALELGYVIVPPFDVQFFAIRTDRAAPPLEREDRAWSRDVKPRALPAGDGEFRNPVVERFSVDSHERVKADGSKYEVKIYENADDWGELEIPARAMKPQIIDAVGRAWQEKVFDALGIAPAYRAADPVICGIIRRPEGHDHLTFMVAWWLDEKDL